ncbi:MAG TPA: hypothetical protein VLM89_01815 [Phycisphaerae bacterium]|nr:hypothetical protein [Phycisphaerae bacterium]
MKRGSDYAKRIKRLYHDLVKKHGRPGPHEAGDPIDQMVVGILSLNTSIAKAQAVYKKLRQQTVDLNELRVTPAIEMAEAIGDGVPLAASKAERVVGALNAVRRRQDTLDLNFLRQRGRREAREYLESLGGVGPTVAAHVVLFSLGGHAIPVDDLTLYVLRKEGLIDNHADAATAQGFLERLIASSEAADFVQLLSRHVSAYASRVPVEKLSDLLHPPAPKPSKPAAEPPAPAAAEPAPKAAPKDKKPSKSPAKAPVHKKK